MGYFSDAASAVLAGRTVRAARLVHFDFTTDPRWVWDGFGQLVAGGQAWSGLGELGSISGLDYGLDGSAPKTTFTLSGVDPALLADTLAAASEVKDRPVTVFEQLFDDNLTLLDSPYAVYLGLMDVMKIVRKDGERTISVTSEMITARQSIPPYSYLTASDQNARYPQGDRGMDEVASLQFKSVIWPGPL